MQPENDAESSEGRKRNRGNQMGTVGNAFRKLYRLAIASLVTSIGLMAQTIHAQDFEHDPINYASAPADNPITRLQSRIDSGEAQLSYEPRTGYLKSLLAALDVPISSQMLVYSKTSLQRHRIAPKTPRAIYFNDDVYVGFCLFGDVLEVSAVDPNLGTVFYSMDQSAAEKPFLQRQNDSCLTCHASSNTRGVPGHLVRSVYSDRNGYPVLSMGTYRVDQTTQVEKRWGGWYVTGTHGEQKHLGNLIVSGNSQREPIDNADGQNVTRLEKYFDATNYLSPHSDLVALMVLEHQTEAHNQLTRANFQTREALFAETRMNKELGEPEGHRWESTNTRIKSVCESLVRYLLFSEETQLTARLQGTTDFASDFAKRGPRDPEGRSLRDFDLEKRLFKYPCSYLIYSRSFDELPTEAKERVLHRMWEVLSGKDNSKEFAHLRPEDRQSILEIIRATKPGLPENWYDDQAAAVNSSATSDVAER